MRIALNTAGRAVVNNVEQIKRNIPSARPGLVRSMADISFRGAGGGGIGGRSST